MELFHRQRDYAPIPMRKFTIHTDMKEIMEKEIREGNHNEAVWDDGVDVKMLQVPPCKA